jgi:hypothetical protein
VFAGTKGAGTVHVLDAASGKEIKEIRMPGEPVVALGCHRSHGLVYAVNLNNEVFAIDPEKGAVTKTKAKGQLLAVDTNGGKYVYTGIQKPIKDQLVFEEQPGRRFRVSLAQANLRAIMLKYEITGTDLKLVAANDNAAVNGRSLGLSGDGKRIAMAGGGWRSKTDPRANYAVAVFDTTDLQTLVGQVETGAYPVAVAFHPVLNLGAAYRDGQPGEVTIFNSKSCAKRDTIKVQKGATPSILAFGGEGTKLVFIPQPKGPGGDTQSIIEFFPLRLRDQDREALKKIQTN